MIFERIRQRLFNLHRKIETDEHCLLYLFLELTRRCNLNCGHCGSDCNKAPSMKELPTDEWLRIIDYLKDRFDPLPFLVISGGEPLVHPDLLKITQYAGDRGFRWGMVSNAFALNETMYQQLLENGLESITISLDGDEEAHNALRRHPKSFQRVVSALRLISASSVATSDVVTCVYPGNLSKLSVVADFLCELNIKNWRLFRIFPKGRAATNPQLKLSHADSLKIVDWIAQNRKNYQKSGLTISFSCEGYLPFGVDRHVRDEPYFCRSGINIAAILCDGTITGCNNNGPEYYQGNVITDDFQTVWNESFTEFRDKSWLRTGKCESCSEWNFCEGSSIHLRSKSGIGPDFCYVKDVCDKHS